MTNDLLVNEDRLWSSLIQLAEFGATPAGGVNRPALSEVDRRARRQFVQWCEALGCVVRADAIGNLFARFAGEGDHAPAVMMGSHLDSQPTGGKFDGAYGVMAGLEVLRTLHANGVRPPCPLELVVWTNEEGSRFAPSMMGSLVYTSQLPLETALSTQDIDGISVAAELRNGAGCDAQASVERPAAYFEAHIEQGPVLEAERKTIGAVTGAQGQCWFQLKLHGRAAHAGTTPMAMRADALVAASAIVIALDRIGREHPPGCATSGRLVVNPNSPNVVPESVFMTAELRHPDDAARGRMEASFRQAVNEVSNERGVRIEVDKVLEQPAAPFSPVCIRIVHESAAARGYPNRAIISGAAHDAVAMSRIVPTGMIFVPCAGGVSHNEKESATPEDLAAGCQVLCDSVLSHGRGVN